MKKIFLLLFAVTGLVALQSCEGPEGIPGRDGESTVAQVFDVPAVNFATAGGGNVAEQIIRRQWTQFDGDQILVYYHDGNNNGNMVWRVLPQTYYFTLGGNGEELDYNFDFTLQDVRIFAEGTTALSKYPQSAIRNQFFRIVVIPGFNPVKVSLSDKSDSAAKSTNLDYESVRKAYNLDAIPVKILQVN